MKQQRTVRAVKSSPAKGPAAGKEYMDRAGPELLLKLNLLGRLLGKNNRILNWIHFKTSHLVDARETEANP